MSKFGQVIQNGTLIEPVLITRIVQDLSLWKNLKISARSPSSHFRL